MLCYVVTRLPIWSCVKSPGKEILWKTVALITSLSENAEKFNVFVAAKNLHISTLQWQIQKQNKFVLPLRVGYFISFISAFFSENRRVQFKKSHLKKKSRSIYLHYNIQLKEYNTRQIHNFFNLTTDSLLIYLFFTSCEPEIVLSFLQIQTKTI